MMFTFKTEVLGVQMEVQGHFYEGVFDLWELKHKNESLEWTGLHDDVIQYICEQAIKEAAKEAMQAEEDKAQEDLWQQPTT